MKFAVVFLALVAHASALEFQEVVAVKQHSISSKVVDAIEAFKLQMPCGVPGLGLPPMAPLKADHKEFNLSTDAIDMKMIADKFRLYGLNEFKIVEFKVNAILSKVSFKFNWPHVQLKSIYDIWLNIHDNKFLSKLNRDGIAKFAVKDFEVRGTAKYSLGMIGGGGLRLKELKIYASVGEVKSEIENLSKIEIVNRKLNEIIEEMVLMAINENTENFAEISNTFVVPLVNDMIGSKTIGDLLGMIGGGGGEPIVKEPCVPPQIED